MKMASTRPAKASQNGRRLSAPPSVAVLLAVTIISLLVDRLNTWKLVRS